MADHQSMTSATEIRHADSPPLPSPIVPPHVPGVERESSNAVALVERTALRKHSRWDEQVVPVADPESFRSHLTIFEKANRAPELIYCVPRLVSSNPTDGTYILKQLNCDMFPLEAEARRLCLSYSDIQDIKNQLYLWVKALYRNGVRYNIRLQSLLLLRRKHFRPRLRLFLGSMASSDSIGAEQLDWEKEKVCVKSQIAHVFVPLEIWALERQAADMARQTLKEMDQAMRTIDAKNGIIDKMKVHLAERHAIMTELSKLIQRSLEILDDCTATHNKEKAGNACEMAIGLHNRANGLIEKYHKLDPDDRASAEDAISITQPIKFATKIGIQTVPFYLRQSCRSAYNSSGMNRARS
ncbi:hypothetical protein GGI42DRAFT_337403 [Trichoderma sp. SZMC 28013]